jgi:hypothetical protein
MKRLEYQDLVAMAKVAPQIDGLVETASECWLGLVGVEKSSVYARHADRTWPLWRDGFNRPDRENMGFRVESFDVAGGGSAVAVILSIPEEDREMWVGWQRSDRAEEVGEWVERMNLELRRLFALWNAAGRPGTPRT